MFHRSAQVAGPGALVSSKSTMTGLQAKLRKGWVHGGSRERARAPVALNRYAERAPHSIRMCQEDSVDSWQSTVAPKKMVGSVALFWLFWLRPARPILRTLFAMDGHEHRRTR